MSKNLNSLLKTIGRPSQAQTKVARIFGVIVDVMGIGSFVAGVVLTFAGQPVAYTYYGLAALCYFYRVRKDFIAGLIALIGVLALFFIIVQIVAFLAYNIYVAIS